MNKRQPGSMNLDLYVHEAVKLQTNWAEKERSRYGFFGNSSLHHRYHGSGSKNGVEPSPNIISSKYTQARGLINMNMIYKMFVFDRII
ncbi:hypothetical protein BRARA_C01652 [Brassica rapa]|uniref:Uncharacterized protein n=2 Tax=Brassica TaxID=3705 RepID=A0ABQ8DT56_BRANA|nr:hypothetical protein HID58_009669 [Brassica napus]RID69564.1 hypothetical protein BRARA_C01652 [Brassica rapa]